MRCGPSPPNRQPLPTNKAFCPGRGKWTRDNRVCRELMGRETCEGCFIDPAYFSQILETTEERLEALRPHSLSVVSRYMGQELSALGIPEENITHVPPYIPPLTASSVGDPGPPCVLFVGRLSVAKGVDAAIDAWRKSGLKIPLVFAGSGRERGRLESEGFEVTGWLPRADLRAFYGRAQALLLPSRWQEPFGIVGIEALRMGVPVVAWESGGVSEWHPGGDLLVPWGDVEALAVALAQAPGRVVAPPDDVPFNVHRARLESLYIAAIAKGGS